MELPTAPPLRTKLIFWMLLAVLSVAFAEVSVASAPLAFVNPFEGAFLMVFYGSHLLLLSWICFRRGWPTLSALWLAGVLFGLYEFYITKVLWAPPWGDTISVAYVDVGALIVLAFFWHPFLAFIFPLAVAEVAATRTRWTVQQLPSWMSPTRRRATTVLVIAAVGHGMVTGNPAIAVVSTLTAMMAGLLVAGWWRRADRHGTWDLRSLLPNDRQGKGVALLVAMQYLVFLPLWNWSRVPPLLGHVVVWLLYAGFALLLRAALRESVPCAIDVGSHQSWPRHRVVQWAGALLFLSAFGSLGPPEVGFVVVWLGAMAVGLWMLGRTLRVVTGISARGRRATTTPPSARAGDREHRL